MQGVIGAEAEAVLQTAGLVVEVEAAHTAAIKSAEENRAPLIVTHGT